MYTFTPSTDDLFPLANCVYSPGFSIRLNSSEYSNRQSAGSKPALNSNQLKPVVDIDTESPPSARGLSVRFRLWSRLDAGKWTLEIREIARIQHLDSGVMLAVERSDDVGLTARLLCVLR